MSYFSDKVASESYESAVSLKRYQQEMLEIAERESKTKTFNAYCPSCSKKHPIEYYHHGNGYIEQYVFTCCDKTWRGTFLSV